MARAYTPKVNRVVTYREADGTLRSAITTAVTDSTHIDVRIGHAGETHANVVRRVNHNDVSVWEPY